MDTADVLKYSIFEAFSTFEAVKLILLRIIVGVLHED